VQPGNRYFPLRLGTRVFPQLRGVFVFLGDFPYSYYTLYIVDLYMTKLYEEVSQIMLISEASVLSRLGVT
jgi:hypothetical protein